MNLLSVIIFLPLLGIPLILLLGQRSHLAKYVSLGTFLLQFILTIVVFQGFDWKSPQLQFSEKYNWINVCTNGFCFISNYHVGLDGLNISLVALSTFVMIIAVLASWKVDKKPIGYFSLLHILAVTTIGCFVAVDLFVFFVFFEFMLLPMYFLISIWGGVRREYASIKFFLFTLSGSLLILVAFIWLFLNIGSFDLFEIKSHLALISKNELKAMMFAFLMIGLMVKLPSVPFHTWLPDAHVEASTPISVILAALLLKTGGYAMIRIGYMVFPDEIQNHASVLAGIGVISIVYAAYNALAMNDLKKMIAYSSISHMGFVMLGIASCNVTGVNGAIFQMVSHGIITSALFLSVGVLYDRVHNRSIDNFRGLAFKMPHFTTATSIAFFASLGLPGFSGFIGEILVLLGAFESASKLHLFGKSWVIVACFGILLSAAYYLWALQRMFFGKYWLKEGAKWSSSLVDINMREKVLLFSLCTLTLILGLMPSIILDGINISVEYLLKITQ